MDLENYLNNKNMKKRFQIIIGSPIDYEELVAYIVIDGEHIALLNQDEGKDKIKIEFFDDPKIKKIDFNILIAALKEAEIELLK
jgi:hypothetical protein